MAYQHFMAYLMLKFDSVVNDCIYPISAMSRMWHKVNFKAKQSLFEFKIFFLLNWEPNQG